MASKDLGQKAALGNQTQAPQKREFERKLIAVPAFMIVFVLIVMALTPKNQEPYAVIGQIWATNEGPGHFVEVASIDHSNNVVTYRRGVRSRRSRSYQKNPETGAESFEFRRFPATKAGVATLLKTHSRDPRLNYAGKALEAINSIELLGFEKLTFGDAQVYCLVVALDRKYRLWLSVKPPAVNSQSQSDEATEIVFPGIVQLLSFQGWELRRRYAISEVSPAPALKTPHLQNLPRSALKSEQTMLRGLAVQQFASKGQSINNGDLERLVNDSMQLHREHAATLVIKSRLIAPSSLKIAGAGLLHPEYRMRDQALNYLLGDKGRRVNLKDGLSHCIRDLEGYFARTNVQCETVKQDTGQDPLKDFGLSGLDQAHLREIFKALTKSSRPEVIGLLETQLATPLSVYLEDFLDARYRWGQFNNPAFAAITEKSLRLGLQNPQVRIKLRSIQRCSRFPKLPVALVSDLGATIAGLTETESRRAAMSSLVSGQLKSREQLAPHFLHYLNGETELAMLTIDVIDRLNDSSDATHESLELLYRKSPNIKLRRRIQMSLERMRRSRPGHRYAAPMTAKQKAQKKAAIAKANKSHFANRKCYKCHKLINTRMGITKDKKGWLHASCMFK